MLQNALFRACDKRVGGHAKHNGHLILAHLNTFHEGPNDFAPHQPVGLPETIFDFGRKITQATDNQSQIGLELCGIGGLLSLSFQRCDTLA